MRSRRPSPEHQAAVNRRLALLSAELAAHRPPAVAAESPEPLDEEVPWWDEHTRVRASATAPSPPSTAPPPAPALPAPGRHAARRGGSRPTGGLVPDTLRGRVLLGPAQLAVVAVLVAVGLAVTCWWLVRGDAGPPGGLTAAPAGPLTAVPDPAPVVAATEAAAEGTPATVTVDVAGKVRRPGIAVLDSGARVVDALAAAGGARPGVDLTGLNLARVVVDGEQILVGLPVPSGAAGAAVPSSGQPGGPLVNLNTATEVELETLPDVGPVTAGAILAWRDQHGGFTSVDELLEVDGIGPATLDRIAPHVTL